MLLHVIAQRLQAILPPLQPMQAVLPLSAAS